jgi:hypothetical protein
MSIFGLFLLRVILQISRKFIIEMGIILCLRSDYTDPLNI